MDYLSSSSRVNGFVSDLHDFEATKQGNYYSSYDSFHRGELDSVAERAVALFEEFLFAATSFGYL